LKKTEGKTLIFSTVDEKHEARPSQNDGRFLQPFSSPSIFM